ncbi:MAG: phosphoribosylglycinamide formyltransferase [Acidimicrobiia bacterium]|nr:phosphoribosylglycinamide formyltransferase [Acidimicrobiia bacterium]
MAPYPADISTIRRSPERSAARVAVVSSELAPTCRIVVLASGSGTNLQVLLDDPSPDWSVVGVVTDRPGAAALDRAHSAGVPSSVVDWNDYSNRAAFTHGVLEAMGSFGPDFVVLAGFMRILGPVAVKAYRNRIVNVHPSLLPAFKGAHAVRDAIEYGVKTTGVTVHFVDEKLDHGPIICQEPVDVSRDDDEATLHHRLQAVEHRLLPRVVQSLASGDLKVVGRKVEGRVGR